MSESTLPPSQREAAPAPSILGGVFDRSSTPPATHVRVTSGIHAENLPVGNQTVGAIRRRFRTMLDIDPASVAVVGGRIVGDDVVVQPGQMLSFIRQGGEKG